MRINRIAAHNFLGYDDLDLDLSGVDSVVVVGRNGHGKSTLLDAVTYALYGKGRFLPPRRGGSPDQQIRDGEDEMWVRVAFETAEGGVEVTRSKARGKAASVQVFVNDEDRATQHTNAETDDLIESLVGVSYDALMAGPIMAQETAGALMEADAADRLKLLVRLFEADWCAPLYEQAKAARDQANAEADAALARLDELRLVLSEEESLTDRLERARQAHAVLLERQSLAAEQLTQIKVSIAESRTLIDAWAPSGETVKRLDRSIVANAGEVDRVAARIGRAQAVLDEPLFDAPDISALEPTQRRLEDARAAAMEQARLEAQWEEAQRTIARMESQYAILDTVPCGGVGEYAACRFLVEAPTALALAEQRRRTAGLGLDNAKAHERAKREQDLATELANLVAAKADYERMVSARQQASEVVEQQTPTLVRLREQIAADTAEADRLDEERKRLDTVAAAIADKEAERLQIEGVLASVRERLGLIEPALRAAEARMAVVTEARASVDDWSARLAAQRERADLYGNLAAAFHPTGIPALIVEQGIGAIEDQANDLLSRLPQDMRVELRTEREKRGGGSMAALDVVVQVDGWERDYAMLSVGQRFRIALALRLGLGAVLAARRGAAIGTLWLDEPLADLDDESREAAVEALNALAADFGLVVVVSHHSEVNDRFPAVITVTQEGGVSHATLAA